MYAKDKTTIIDRREMLRIKFASLVAESRIIRNQERRTFGLLRHELSEHRRGTVRWHARHTGLALGLIRGRTLAQMEPKSEKKPDFKAINDMFRKYGPKEWKLNQDFSVTKAGIRELLAA